MKDSQLFQQRLEKIMHNKLVPHLLVSVNTGRPTVFCFAKSTQLWSNHFSPSICHHQYEDAQMNVLPLLLENREIATQNGNCRRLSDVQGDDPIFQVLYALNTFRKHFMAFCWGKGCYISRMWSMTHPLSQSLLI